MRINFVQNFIDFLRHNKEIKELKIKNKELGQDFFKYESLFNKAVKRCVDLDLLAIMNTYSFLCDEFSKDTLVKVIKIRTIPNTIDVLMRDFRERRKKQMVGYENKYETIEVGGNTLYYYEFLGGGGVSFKILDNFYASLGK
jgi:hypothetical protein